MNKVYDSTFWMPKGASTVAAEVDALYYGIYWMSVAFFVAIVGAMAYFAVRYKRRSKDEIPHGPHHNLSLEVTWTVIPTIILVALFVWGFQGFLRLMVAPGNAYEVNVTARQWSWTFDYPGGVVKPAELTVPAGRPIKLIMTATDVLHSFWVPDFRIKHDIVPGQYATVWFEAMEPGEHRVLCTEYCGLDHSNMLGKVTVLPQADFDKWIEKEQAEAQKGGSPEELGAKLYTTQACIGCHSKDGTPMAGPTFKGLFGRSETLEDGSTVTVDENYLRESIVDPRKKMVKGFQPVMPENFGKTLKPEQVDALVAFIKSLK